MPKKKTHEEFLNEMNVVAPHLLLLSHYDGFRGEIKVFNTLCSHTYLTTPAQIHRGNSCPMCNTIQENNKIKYVEQLNLKYNNSLTLMSEYTGIKNGISYCCDVCGHIDTTRADTLMLYGCKNCNLKSRTKTHEVFVKEVASISPNIEILSKYKTSREDVTCRCRVCGYEWNTRPANLTSHNNGCPSCKGVAKRTHEDFVKELFEKGKHITFLSTYQGVDSKIECQCDLCGHVWITRAGKILHEDTGCPNCRRSKGEERIAKFLDDNKIDYTPQKKFDGLLGVGNRRLSYDFYIPSQNVLIEFNGLQHEQKIEWFGGNERFERQKEHDLRKRRYAFAHGYNLINIRYSDIDNVEKILQEKIFS